MNCKLPFKKIVTNVHTYIVIVILPMQFSQFSWVKLIIYNKAHYIMVTHEFQKPLIFVDPSY